MTYDLPRVILLESDTVIGAAFICGFVNLQPGNTNGIGAGTFLFGENGELPSIVFAEDQTVKVNLPVQSLPAYIFTGEGGGMPKELNVMFENQAGKKSPKIKVTATQGHPNDDFPEFYIPRVFILCDKLSGQDGSGSLIYGFLMDIYKGDVIECLNLEWDGIPQVTVDSTNQISEKPQTGIFLFPINQTINYFTLNLKAQNMGTKDIFYDKAPEYYTLNQ